MNTEQTLKKIEKIRADLDMAMWAMGEGSRSRTLDETFLYAEKMGTHIGKAHRQILDLEKSLNRQAGREEALKPDTMGGYPK